ncbi:hypothetical protein ACRAQ6_13920 [Erythrobacter sp. HA6-11]
MANRWCDGFGRYGGSKPLMLNGSSSQAWAEVPTDTSLVSLSGANPRTGTHCYRYANGVTQRTTRRVFGAQLTEVFLGCAIYFHTLPTTETSSSGQLTNGSGGWCLFSLRDQSNGDQCSIWLGTDGALEARRRSTILGRSDPVIGAGAYQHIEVHAVAGTGTSGALEIRVDEATVLNLTGINTISTSNVEFSQWSFGPQTLCGYTTADFADFFCNDAVDDGSGCNTWIGDCKSGWREPDADTAQADFTKSTGSVGFDLLDDTPPNDATFIATSATSARSDFGLAAGPVNTSEILTTRPAVRAWKDDAGTAQVSPSMASGGVKATVSSQPIATAPAYYDSNVPLNPDTGAPWTPAELDAALEVIERAA